MGPGREPGCPPMVIFPMRPVPKRKMRAIGEQRLRGSDTRPPERTRFIGALNAAMAGARRAGLARRPVLEKQALLNQSRQLTGLDDFGDDWFEGPLDVLLDAIAGEARLNAAGEWSAMKQFVKVLGRPAMGGAMVYPPPGNPVPPAAASGDRGRPHAVRHHAHAPPARRRSPF